MAQSVTVKDVARAAEVSIGTVSNVFNNHPSVTHETRERVLRVAVSLGYQSQSGRSRPAPRPLKEVGFLLYDANLGDRPATANPFWSHILAGVESEAHKNTIRITYKSLANLSKTPDLLLSTVQEMKLGGVLLVGHADVETIRQLHATHIPLVLVDNCLPRLPIDSVMADNYEGAKAAVEMIIEAGHRRIAFIGGPTITENRPINTIYTIERRAMGYRSLCSITASRLDYDLYEANNLEIDGSYHACRRLMARNPDFSAIFCANDNTAIGAIKALREAGRRVPDDVSVVGFDDIEMAAHVTPT